MVTAIQELANPETLCRLYDLLSYIKRKEALENLEAFAKVHQGSELLCVKVEPYLTEIHFHMMPKKINRKAHDKEQIMLWASDPENPEFLWESVPPNEWIKEIYELCKKTELPEKWLYRPEALTKLPGYRIFT